MCQNIQARLSAKSCYRNTPTDWKRDVGIGMAEINSANHWHVSKFRFGGHDGPDLLKRHLRTLLKSSNDKSADPDQVVIDMPQELIAVEAADYRENRAARCFASTARDRSMSEPRPPGALISIQRLPPGKNRSSITMNPSFPQ